MSFCKVSFGLGFFDFLSIFLLLVLTWYLRHHLRFYSILFYSILFYSILFYSILFYILLINVNTYSYIDIEHSYKC